jgi:hypothetical protein
MRLISTNRFWKVKYFQGFLPKIDDARDRMVNKMKIYAKSDNKRADTCVRIMSRTQYLVKKALKRGKILIVFRLKTGV